MSAPQERVHAAAGAPASLASRAARSAAWSFAQNGVKHALSFLLFVALARLLDPHAYGLVAVCVAIITLANVFMEQGLSDALVQRRELEESHLVTAFWINVASGAALAALLQVAAAPIALLVGQPDAAPILRALSVLFVLNSLGGVPQALMQRRLQFRGLAIRMISSLAAGGAVGLALAYRGFGPWSLVGQQITSAAVGAGVLWWASGWRPRGRPSLRHARDLLGFGRHVMGVGLIDFMNRKSDDLIIGIFLGPVALGLYNVAYQMLTVLEQLVCKGFDALALSAFSRLQDDRPRIREALYATAQLSSVFAFPVFLGAMVVAQDAVAGLLGPAWAASVPTLRILLATGLVHAVFHYHHAAFKACGSPGLSVRLGLVEAVVNVTAFLVVVRWGIEAMAAAYAARAYLLAPLSLRALRETVGISQATYLGKLWRPLLASGAMALTVLALGQALPESLGPAWRLSALVVAGVLAYPLWMRALFPALFAELRQHAAMLRRNAGWAPAPSDAGVDTSPTRFQER